jgi:hypothetical protein
MSTDTAPSESTAESVQFGSFIVQQTSMKSDGSPTTAVGAEDGSFSGVAAMVSSIPVPTTPDERAQAEVRLAKLRHLDHAALVPVLETGITDGSAYWIQALPDGAPLADSIGAGPWSIGQVRNLVTSIGSALQIAHEIGLSHESITPATVFLRADGSPLLAGLGIAGREPARDQADLARLAIDLLAERPWVEPEFESDDQSAVRAERMRESLSTSTMRVVKVLSRASDPDPDQRFASLAAFVAEFTTAIQLSAEDLVHGAYEAISARNPELAQLLSDKADAYDPGCENLVLLKIQLRGGSPFEQTAHALIADPSGEATLAPELGNIEPVVPTPAFDLGGRAHSLLPPELTQGLPQEFLDAIAPQFQAKPVKKGMNPMLVLAMGGAGMLLLLAAAGLATLLLSGR